MKRAVTDFDSTVDEIIRYKSFIDEIELTDYVAQKLCDVLQQRVEESEKKIDDYTVELKNISGKDYTWREFDEDNLKSLINGLKANVRVCNRAWNAIIDKHRSDIKQFLRRSDNMPYKRPRVPKTLRECFISDEDYRKIFGILVERGFQLEDGTLHDTSKAYQSQAAGIIGTLARKQYFKPGIKPTTKQGIAILTETWGISMSKNTYETGRKNKINYIPDREANRN